MKLVLHIGLPKTGSTRIQNAAIQAKDFMESKFGIYWPSECSYNPGEGDTEGHHKLAMLLNSGQRETAISLVRNAILSASYKNCGTVLLSSEGFAVVGLEKVKPILEMPEFQSVKIFGYLRHPAQILISWYAQDVHAQMVYSDIASWHRKRINDVGLLACLKKWPKGDYEFLLRPFNRELFPQGDIWLHFLKYCLNIDSRDMSVIYRGYTGLKHNLLFLKRVINTRNFIKKAANGGVSIQEIEAGQTSEAGFYWHLFNELSLQSYFQSRSGYPFSKLEADYITTRATDEFNIIKDSRITNKECIRQLSEINFDVNNLRADPLLAEYMEDIDWIRRWVESIRPDDAMHSRRIIAENSESIHSDLRSIWQG